MATTMELNNAYDENTRQKQVNDIYDAQKSAQLSQLEGAYQQNRANYEAEAAKIPETYQQQRNDLAAQYERQRRNFNEGAAVSGINTGTASQAELALQNAYQRNTNAIGVAQANAQTEADRTLANLEANYKSAVATAIAENDYKRANALMAAYESDRADTEKAQAIAKADAENAAKIKAAYGDFSGYEALYGADAAGNMRSVWAAQNPDLAYNTGAISAEEYRGITGKYPAGYTAPTAYVPQTVEPIVLGDNAKLAATAYKSMIPSVKDNYLWNMVKNGNLTQDEADYIEKNYK